MKNILLVFLLIFTNSLAFANDNIASQNSDFTNKSFELLIKNINADSIELVGKALPNEKLKPIFEDLGDYFEEVILPTLMMDSEAGNYKGKIKDFKNSCLPVVDSENIFLCTLKLHYTDQSQLTLDFYILSHQNQPVEIVNNRVSLSR